MDLMFVLVSNSYLIFLELEAETCSNHFMFLSLFHLNVIKHIVKVDIIAYYNFFLFQIIDTLYLFFLFVFIASYLNVSFNNMLKVFAEICTLPILAKCRFKANKID